jgi:hypothetical protein
MLSHACGFVASLLFTPCRIECFESCDTGSVVKIAALLHQLVDRRQVVFETNPIVLPTMLSQKR